MAIIFATEQIAEYAVYHECDNNMFDKSVKVVL